LRLWLRIATLTNSSAASTSGLLEGAGLADLVERNLGVSEVGRWKPTPEPYEHACRTLGVAPDAAAS
jgi:2-haloacid dehalogenase